MSNIVCPRSIRVGDEIVRKDLAKFRVTELGPSLGRFRALRYDTLKIEELRIGDVRQVFDEEGKAAAVDLEDLDEKEKERLTLVKETVESYRNAPVKSAALATECAIKLGLSISQFYKTLSRYTGSLRSLMVHQSDGGRGVPRTKREVEEIVTRIIRTRFDKPDANTRKIVFEQIKQACEKKGLAPVSESTIRRRMHKKAPKILAAGKYGRIEAENMYGAAAGNYKEAIAPLQVVQIDHTPLDVYLVDESSRERIGRAWLTLAIDVYSRMIMGLYVSFEDPSTNSVAVCIYRSAMPKDDYLKKLGLKAEWPVWGVMHLIHADNGPDFRTDELGFACKEHKMDLQWRPIKTARFGAHIERLAKTVNDEVKKLAGGIAADFKQRKHEAAEKKAIYSLADIERHLVIWITQVYHNQFHEGVGCSPLQKFQEGLLGGERPVGIPLPPSNPERFLLDLTPSEFRTVQRDGIEINNMRYYDWRLEPFILARDPNHPKLAQKFRCRTPMDDARIIYFQNPTTKEYYEIKCSDLSMPPLTRHELIRINKHLRKKGMQKIDMRAIKKGYEELQQLQHEILTRKGKSTAAKSVRRQKAITKSLKEMSPSLPHKVQPPATENSPVEISESDIPTFSVTR